MEKFVSLTEKEIEEDQIRLMIEREKKELKKGYMNYS